MPEGTDKLREQALDLYLKDVAERCIVPGIVFAAGNREGISLRSAYGKRRLFPFEETMTEDTVFDLASLTKVVATWAAVMKLIERGRMQLDMMVGEIDRNVKETPVGSVTIAQLLTHTGGLSERTWLIQYGRDPKNIYRGICEEELDWKPGTHVAYSNRGFILLGFLVEKVSGFSLDVFLEEEIWKPTGMYSTMYRPSGLGPIAPTELEQERGAYLCGTVHDENCRVLNGVAGHAGVFSTVDDLCRFCTMVVNSGKSDGVQILDSGLIERSFANYTQGLGGDRGYGWQKCPAGETMYRHFGFTGTTIWMDIVRGEYYVMLTNRVHPNRETYLNGIQEVRAGVQRIILG